MPHELLNILQAVLFAGIGVLGWMFFWQFWDNQHAKPLPTLFLAILWGAFFTYLLKNFLDDIHIIPVSFSFFITIILLEEFIKAFAEVNAIECTGQKFCTRNDGIFYGVAAALGFVFVETTFYLISAPDFWAVFWGRLIYSAPAHMSFTGIFGMYYGRAYLGSTLLGKYRKLKKPPLAIPGNLVHRAILRLDRPHRHKFFPILFALLREAFALLTLHITRRHLILSQPTHGHSPSELITEGFFLAFYLHISYDLLLSSVSPIFRILGLFSSTLLFGFLLWRFLRLEQREPLTQNIPTPLPNLTKPSPE